MSTNSLPEIAHVAAPPLISRRTSILTGLAAVTFAATASAQEAKENPELNDIHALLKAHDEALRRQDLPAIMATMAEKAAVMGTGPGEIWSGPEEIKAAYEHFFQGFDKGEQVFDYHFRLGGLGAGMGWLMASGNIKGKKGGKDFEFPINISLTVTQRHGKWLIASMHFSTLTADAGPEGKK